MKTPSSLVQKPLDSLIAKIINSSQPGAINKKQEKKVDNNEGEMNRIDTEDIDVFEDLINEPVLLEKDGVDPFQSDQAMDEGFYTYASEQGAEQTVHTSTLGVADFALLNDAKFLGYGALEVTSTSTLLLAGASIVGAAALGGGGSDAQSPNNAPTLSNSPLYLPDSAVGINPPSGATGALISAFTHHINDKDLEALKGIAVTGIDTASGKLFYSTDNGLTWFEMVNASETRALALADDGRTLLYFQNNPDVVGIVPNTVLFKAWDRTSGQNGLEIDVSGFASDSAHSEQTGSIALKIIPELKGDYIENGNPVVINELLTLPIPVSGFFSYASVQINGGMVDGDMLHVESTLGISANYTPALGQLTFSGQGTQSEYESLLRSVTFSSTSDNPTQLGAVRSIVWKVEDATNSHYADLVSQLRIVSTNDAPIFVNDFQVLSANGFGSIEPNIYSGNLVAKFTQSIIDPDGPYAKKGIAIYETAPQTLLHFSMDGGRSWAIARDLSDLNALHLAADLDNRFYIQTLEDFSGNASNSFAFKAWDQTMGIDGLLGKIIPAGGTTAYSISSGGGLSVEPTRIELLNSNPSDNGFMLNVKSNIELLFSEVIFEGSTGALSIFDDNGLVYSFGVSSDSITGWGGAKLIIDPPADLTFSTNYYINIDEGFIKGVNNIYEGFNDKTTLNFSTVSANGGVEPTLNLGSSGGRLGSSVAAVGDVNGDGFMDYAVSAPEVGGSQGDVFVIYGNKEGSLPNFIDGEISPSDGYRIRSLDTSGQLGFDVTGAGDINGDGFDDILLGTRGNAAAYIIYGNETGTGANISAVSGANPGILDAPAGGFTILGSTDSPGYFGWNVSGLGDTNKDGYSDYIITHTDKNDAFVIYGGKGDEFDINVISGTIDPSVGFKLKYPAGTSWTSTAGSVGDFNGNGQADMALTDDNGGNGFIIFSTPQGAYQGNPNTMSASDGLKIIPRTSSYKIRKISSLGDINGDGYADIGVIENTNSRAYVIYGRPEGGVINLASLTPDIGYEIRGEGLSGVPFTEITSAGDMNGDGLADIFLGHQHTNTSWLVYGNGSSTPVTLSPNMASNDKAIRIRGGSDVETAGDINGDGFNDLLIGNKFANGGSGAYSIVFGGTQFVNNAITGKGQIFGTIASEAIIGSNGDDILIGGGGVDRFFAGNGNDTIVLSASDISNLQALGDSLTTVLAVVDGGGGFDTLRVNELNAHLDLRLISNAGIVSIKENSRIERIERIDLGNNNVENSLYITSSDINDMSSFNLINTNGVSADGNTWFNVSGDPLSTVTKFRQVVVDGNQNDTVNIEDDRGIWEIAGQANYEGGDGYVIYHNMLTNSQLIINQNINVINNDNPYIAGEAIIDLGDLGQLIAPVQVEGNWYYFLDANKSGSHDTNDRVSMVTLEDHFFGSSPGSGMSDSNRETVINGVTLRLPTRGDNLTTIGNKRGTSVDSPDVDNPTYDDLMAIWDAFNGSSTNTSIGGRPPMWANSVYWSSSEASASDHFRFDFSRGDVSQQADFQVNYVALQVL